MYFILFNKADRHFQRSSFRRMVHCFSLSILSTQMLVLAYIFSRSEMRASKSTMYKRAYGATCNPKNTPNSAEWVGNDEIEENRTFDVISWAFDCLMWRYQLAIAFHSNIFRKHRYLTPWSQSSKPLWFETPFQVQIIITYAREKSIVDSCFNVILVKCLTVRIK